MKEADGSRHLPWGVLVLLHGFILWRAWSAGLRLDDVAWLYWFGSFFLIASIVWRMHKSLMVARADVRIVALFLALLQALCAAFLVDEGRLLRWGPEVLVLVPAMAAHFWLDLRRQLRFDDLQSPTLIHFLALWFARLVPFGVVFALPLAFPGRVAQAGPHLVAAFLAGVAAMDILLHLTGPGFGRYLTVWQQKRYAKSSNNYLKWYRPRG